MAAEPDPGQNTSPTFVLDLSSCDLGFVAACDVMEEICNDLRAAYDTQTAACVLESITHGQ